MLPIPQHEKQVVFRLFAYSLGIATSYVIARTVGDSLFLSRVGSDQLALVYVLSGICTAIVAALWYLATRRFSVPKSIQLSSIIFAVLTGAAWYLLPSMKSSFWLLAGIYLLAEIKGCINTINVVSALNSKLGRDASKASWAMVGIAAPVAAVMTGSVLALESQLLSLRDWLLAIVAIDVYASVVGLWLEQTTKIKDVVESSTMGNDSNPLRRPTKKEYVCSNQFQTWIGVLIAAKVIALTIVSFEWKSAVNAYYEGDSDRLVRFFGVYYGAVGLTTIVLQVLLTSRLLTLRIFGVPLLLMPVALILLSGLFWISPTVTVTLIATTAAKSLEAWRRSVHDTTLNLLYTRIKRNSRRFVISLNSGLVKPAAEVVSASVIFFLSAPLYRPILLVVLIVWSIAAIRLVRLVATTKVVFRSGKDQTEIEN